MNAPHTAPSVGEPELHINIERDECVEYEGTAAQLVAEGLIPSGFEWPHGGALKGWRANGLRYVLRRARPPGHKGPRRSWLGLGLDHWYVYMEVDGRDHFWTVRQKRKRAAEEAAAAIHRNTPAGAAEMAADERRYQVAVSDRAFQAFKAMVPALARRKRSRTADACAQGVQQ